MCHVCCGINKMCSFLFHIQTHIHTITIKPHIQVAQYAFWCVTSSLTDILKSDDGICLRW